MKKLNKLISIISAMVLVLALAVFSVSASNEGIMPCSDYYSTNNPICYPSGASSMVYGYEFRGQSPTSYAKITCQLQQKMGAWEDVAGQKFSGTTTNNCFKSTRTYSNAVSGRYYRVKVDVELYNSSGSVLKKFTNYGAQVLR